MTAAVLVALVVGFALGSMTKPSASRHEANAADALDAHIASLRGSDGLR